MHAQDQGASTAATVIADVVDKYDADLIDLRRDLHAHPELPGPRRTADLVAKRLDEAGLAPVALPRNGFAVDIGRGGPLVALRADLDALPVHDRTDDPWVSTVQGVATPAATTCTPRPCSAPGCPWPRSAAGCCRAGCG